MVYAWSLATVAPNREFHVSEVLSSLELEHRVFRVLSKVPVNGQFVFCLRPVFPGYAFVRPESHHEDVLSVVGITGFVRFGDVMIDLDPIVEDLDEESDGTSILPWADREIDDEPSFVSGDKVRVTEGTMKNTVGIFSKYVSRGKAIVLIEVMRRMVPLTINDADLKLVDKRRRLSQRRRNRSS